MQKLAIGGIKLEGFPTPNGNIRVVLHSSTGQQELFVSLAEWSGLANIETVLNAAGEQLAKLQRELERTRAEIADMRAKQAAFVEATSHG